MPVAKTKTKKRAGESKHDLIIIIFFNVLSTAKKLHQKKRKVSKYIGASCQPQKGYLKTTTQNPKTTTTTKTKQTKKGSEELVSYWILTSCQPRRNTSEEKRIGTG